MREFVPLLRLRWRAVQENLIYLVRIGLEYDPAKRTVSERLYGLYLVVIISVLVLLPGWAELIAYTYAVGHVLPPHLRSTVLDALPAAIVLGQIALAMAALRSSPFKLSSPDSAYVAAAPVPRGAPILAGFLFRAAGRALVWALLAALVAVALAGPDALGSATRDCIAVAVTTLPLAVFSWGVAWSVGLLRLVSPAAQRVPVVWLAPLVALLPAYTIPGVMRWPGDLLVTAMWRWDAPPQAWWLVGLAVLATAAVTLIGNRVNLTLVAAESVLYARLQSLGLMARFIAPTLAWQIRRQEKLRARRFSLHLPRAMGLGAVAARAAIGRMHHPFVLIRPLVWGAAFSRLGGALVLGHADFRLWIYWLIAVVVTAPRSVAVAFKEDVDEPFLRQFLPVDTLPLLLADAALPFVLLCCGALLAWVGQPAPPLVVLGGVVLSVLMALLVLLGQGAGLVPLGPWRAHVAPAASIGVCFVAVVATGLATHSIIAPLTVAIVCAAVLGQLIAASP